MYHRESIDSLFVSFKKLKYSYSLEHPHATPHADTSADTTRATIPFHRNFSNIPLYTFPGGGKNETTEAIFLISRSLPRITNVEPSFCLVASFSRSFAPRPQIFVSPAK